MNRYTIRGLKKFIEKADMQIDLRWKVENKKNKPKMQSIISRNLHEM